MLSMSEETISIRDLAFKFAATEYARGKAPGQYGLISSLKQAVEIGFFDLAQPEKPGTGGDASETLCAVLDALSRVEASLSLLLLTHACAIEILSAGNVTDEPGIHSKAGGMIFAFPIFDNPSELTELPEIRMSGSEARVTGRVRSLIGGGIAERAIIPTFDNNRQIRYVLVQLQQSAVELSAPVFTLGVRNCPMVDAAFLDAMAVPVGPAGSGVDYFHRASNRLFPAAAAIALGLMHGALEEACAYSRTRIQGGRSIVDWSALRMILADMIQRVDVAEMLVTQIIRITATGQRGHERFVRNACAHVQQLACLTTEDGIQVLGGYGYMADYGQERRFRDAHAIQTIFGMPMTRHLGSAAALLETCTGLS